MLIYNARIVTMTDTDYENGYIKIKDGKIKAIGDMSELTGRITRSDIDASGLTVYPGFIDAHCHVGAFEDGLGFEGDDGNEDTDPVTPNLRAIDMINPMDNCFFEAVSAGVTSVLSGMGSANAIGGSFVAMKTYGSRCIDKLIIRDPVSIKFALGENPKTVYKDKDNAPVTRMATAALIREQLYKAKRYLEDMTAYEESRGTDDELDKPEYDAKCEALIPLLERKIKAHFHCHRADDIFTAIRISKEFGLDYVLIHATEGHLISKELKEENSVAVIGPVISERCKPELKNHTIATAAALARENILFAICTDHPVVPLKYLPLSAALAVKGGLPAKEALKAITIYPAIIADISDRVGSIEVGKDADLVIFDGSPLDVQSSPEYVIVDGNIAAANG